MTRKPGAASKPAAVASLADDYAAELEEATRGLLALNVVVLEHMERRIGLAPLRALQALQHLGPSQVTELGRALELVPSSASRLSDRLADSGLISRRVAPHNRRATILELTDAGRAVLDELIAHRVEVFRDVSAGMSAANRTALVRGAAAFTVAYNELADRTAQAERDSS